MAQASSRWKEAQDRLERHDELPRVLIQVEAVLGWTSDAQTGGGGELRRLLQAFDAFGVVACFVTYARTARDIERAERMLHDAVGGEEGIEPPRLVCISETTTKLALLYALTYPNATFQRTILFCCSADDALATSARGRNVEVVSCSTENSNQMNSTFFLQHIVRSHVRMHKAPAPEEKKKKKPPVVVGYLVKWSRACSLGRQGLLHLQVIDGVCYAPVEHAMNLQQQPITFDLLLHKASDWIVCDDEDKAILALPPVFESLKDARWLDAVDTTMPILSRMDIHRLIVQLETENRNVFLPNTGLLQECESSSSLEGRAPFIVKSNVACGVSFSHKMIIAHRYQKVEFEKLLTTCYANLRDLVVQDFIQHDGYEMKVYCIGEESYLYRRQLGEESPSADDAGDFTAFDSLESKSANSNKTKYPVQDADKEVLLECAKWLRTKLKLTLFGFDALKLRGTTGQIAIIDINYFPSFKGIPGARQCLRSVCLERIAS